MSYSMTISNSALAGPGTYSLAPYTASLSASPHSEVHHQVDAPFASYKKYLGVGLGLPSGVNERNTRIAAVIGGYKPDHESVTSSEAGGLMRKADERNTSGQEGDITSSPCLSFLSVSRHSRPTASSEVFGPSREPRVPFSPLPALNDAPSVAETPAPALQHYGLGFYTANCGQRAQIAKPDPGSVAAPDNSCLPPSPCDVAKAQSAAIPHADLVPGVTQDGFDQSTYPFQSGPEGNGARTEQNDQLRSRAVDEVEAHYHLPCDLFSTELTMSTTEFTSSVRRWAHRRRISQLASRAPGVRARL